MLKLLFSNLALSEIPQGYFNGPELKVVIITQQPRKINRRHFGAFCQRIWELTRVSWFIVYIWYFGLYSINTVFPKGIRGNCKPVSVRRYSFALVILRLVIISLNWKTDFLCLVV